MAKPKFSMATLEYGVSPDVAISKLFKDPTDGRINLCRALNEPSLNRPTLLSGLSLAVPHSQNFNQQQVQDVQGMLKGVNNLTQPMSPREAAFLNKEESILDFAANLADPLKGAVNMSAGVATHLTARLKMMGHTLGDLEKAYRVRMEFTGKNGIGNKAWQNNIRKPILDQLNRQMDSIGKRLLLVNGKEANILDAIGLNHNKIGGSMRTHGSKADLDGLAKAVVKNKKITSVVNKGGSVLLGVGAAVGAMDAYSSFHKGDYEEGTRKVVKTAGGTLGGVLMSSGTKSMAGFAARRLAFGAAAKPALALAACTGPVGFIVAGIAIAGASYLASEGIEKGVDYFLEKKDMEDIDFVK